MVLLLYVSNPKHIFDEKILRIQDSLFACANKLVLQIARPFKKFSFVFSFVLLLVYYAVVKVQCSPPYRLGKSGGLKWTRTIDLALIRRAL